MCKWNNQSYSFTRQMKSECRYSEAHVCTTCIEYKYTIMHSFIIMQSFYFSSMCNDVSVSPLQQVLIMSNCKQVYRDTVAQPNMVAWASPISIMPVGYRRAHWLYSNQPSKLWVGNGITPSLGGWWWRCSMNMAMLVFQGHDCNSLLYGKLVVVLLDNGNADSVYSHQPSKNVIFMGLHHNLVDENEGTNEKYSFYSLIIHWLLCVVV